VKKIIWIILAIFLLVGIIGFYGVKKWHYNQQELTAYITVMGFNTIEECDKYLFFYPNGKHRTEVYSLKEQLQRKKEEEERIEREQAWIRQQQIDEERKLQQERDRISQETIIQSTDPGAIINNVRWATRNVNTPGTFTVSSESTGKYYQWNRRTGWDATASSINGSTPSGTNWSQTNDPCPDGWRLPTKSELQSLINAGYRWTIIKGVSGALFGVAPNQIFLPASGLIVGVLSDGELEEAGEVGNYWSSTQDQNYTGNAINLTFNRNNIEMTNFARVNALCIRCVAK
jgi:uncharacterized protein (TIGR02145 family)